MGRELCERGPPARRLRAGSARGGAGARVPGALWRTLTAAEGAERRL